MYDVHDVEKEMQAFWEEIDLLAKINDKNEDGEPYWLLDGPPYANYIPHAGHMKTTVMKDLYIRMAMLEGKDVWFQPGFDTHGLPIENMVEKDLDLESTQDIEALGISTFVKKCRESATNNKDLWLEYYDRLGSWYSWKEPYLTYDNSYLESAWWAFKQQWNKGMVYEGKKPVHWCPHCQTALAGYEVTDSYKQVTDPGVYVTFQLDDRDAALLAFTTTPWTLPSNVALVVAPDETYVEVATDKGNLILAKERLDLIETFELDHDVVDEFPGDDLVGATYEPLIDVPVQQELKKNPKAHQVYASIPILKERGASKVSDEDDTFEEFVNVEEGTGTVHTAPGHGKTDNYVGKHYDLPEVSPLDDACKFTDDAGMWAGEYVKDADHAIADHLDTTGKLLHYEQVTHNYPLCWRCKSPLIFRMSNQWFLKVDPIKDEMLEANEHVDWQPDFARERFRNWVANAEDWNISRQRYWGIPIPVWQNDSGEVKVISSLDELQDKAVQDVPDDFDLHAASDITLKSDDGNEPLERVDHIFDVWYDSGCAPYASLGYPKENKDKFETYFPVNRISESQDQIRGWFYSLMFNGMSVFEQAPYQTVSMPGWVLDPKGEKMSKSIGNVVWAKEALDDVGADMNRFYYCWEKAPYDTTKFNLDIIKQEVRKFFNIYWNLHNYVLSFDVDTREPHATHVEDEWILSRLHTVVRDGVNAIHDFEPHEAGRLLYDFVIDDLSRTYVQMVRERVDDDNEPIHVINHCLLEISTLLAAISPHIAEKVYQDLKAINTGLEESVHLTRLDTSGESDPELEHLMDVAQAIIQSALAARDRAQLGLRWPAQSIIIDTDQHDVERMLKRLSDVVERQVNVRSVVIDHVQPDYEVSPAYDKLGPEFGTETGDVADLITANADELAAKLKDGEETFRYDGYDFTKEHLDVTTVPPDGYEVSESKYGNIYLNTELTPALRDEGFAREIMRRVQQLRKEAELDKEQRIDLYVETTELQDVVEAYEDEIKDRVGATTLKWGSEAQSPYDENLKDSVHGKTFTVMFTVQS